MEIRPVQSFNQTPPPAQAVKTVNSDGSNPEARTPGTSAQNNQALLAQVLKQLPGSNFVSVKLLNNQQMIQIENTHNLKPGQLIQLTLGSSELKLQTNPQQTADQILRLLLPRQGSVKEALNALLNTSNPVGPVKSDRGLSPEVTRLVENIVKQLPLRGDIIKPTLLKQILQNTGLLSRFPATASPATPSLATPSLAIGREATVPGFGTKTIGQSLLPILKSLLFSNPGQVDTRTQETSARLADLLARVMLSQMRSLNPLEGDDTDIRRTELLARSDNQIDSFHIQFSAPKTRNEKENGNKNNENENQRTMERRWTVRLSFDFQSLGSMTAIIVLSAEKQLEMKFWSERPETLLLINEHRKAFQNQLQEKMASQGIELSMEVFKGKAPQQDVAISSSLVDEQV